MNIIRLTKKEMDNLLFQGYIFKSFIDKLGTAKYERVVFKLSKVDDILSNDYINVVVEDSLGRVYYTKARQGVSYNDFI